MHRTCEHGAGSDRANDADLAADAGGSIGADCSRNANGTADARGLRGAVNVARAVITIRGVRTRPYKQ